LRPILIGYEYRPPKSSFALRLRPDARTGGIVKIRRPVVFDPEPNPGFAEGPSKFVYIPEGRLITELREAAQARDPVEILARSAAEFHRVRRQPTVLDREAKSAYAAALADLAVTGRESYRAFGQGLDAAKLTVATRGLLAGDADPPTDGELRAAIDLALDRAYAVAWALRGPAAQRPELRAALGWLAVSAEDDTPHRPVNTPAPPYEQYEIRVQVRNISALTRFFIASAEEPAAAPIPPERRQLPPDPVPTIPPEHEVILFLHGHSSGAEEALDIVPRLLEAGLERGKKYSIISFDLPNNGYSETFDHTGVAPASDTTYPRLPTDHGPILTPVLDFIEDFVVAFASRLNDVMPIEDRFAAVIGGSLGGSLGLRLGRRDLTSTPWLGRAIVSWSPAGVWNPKAQHPEDYLAPDKCMQRCTQPEKSGSRFEYFQQVYDKSDLPGILAPQSEYWYRPGWDLGKLHVRLSRFGRREIYNAHYRQWHWRVAGEQLVFSHFDRVDHEDSMTPLRYELNRVPMLLAAGAADNGFGTKIYENTAKLAGLMVNTPGRLLQVRDTGHSIHIERPREFAREIVEFLTARSLEVTCVSGDGNRIRTVGVTDRTVGSRPSSFRLTSDQCLTMLRQGHELFVLGADGSRADVSIGVQRSVPPNGNPGSGEPRDYYLTTSGDDSLANNLRSLPKCPPP
jgi:pimeloyl-ACP methyl ester carboxylesterase